MDMDIASVKLSCLQLAGGVVREAEKSFVFVSGEKPHAGSIAALERAAEICEHNAPIHATEGNAEQAACSKANGEGYRAAAAYLETLSA